MKIRAHAKADLIALLIEARRLDNLIVKNSREVAAWRRKVDLAVEGALGDDPEARYDAPARQEHREFVDRLFRRT
jgi:hypothetical protein